MNKFLKKIFVLGWFVLIGGFVLAQSSFDPMNMPKFASYINDYSNVISQSDLTNINSLFESYDKQTSNQFVAVLFPNRNGYELFDIGMKAFGDNQIGQASKDNGLLLLISTEEKKIRIIVGYGLEGNLPDSLVKRIIEDDIRPFVNSGDFVGALNAFYKRCSEAITNDESANYSVESFSSFSINSDQGNGLWIFGMIIGIILSLFIKQKKISKSVKKIGIPLIIGIIIVLLFWLGILLLFGVLAGLVFGFTGFMPGRGGFGGGGFGGGGFGGGGFSGGGGSSGGGGAGD